MNCRRAEQLLPLHAGGDLAEGRERAALRAHLELCEGCRRAAAVWAEELRLLRQDEPPEFGADFFDSIRRDVMREIRAAEATARPALSAALLARWLGPKPLAYAASLALICALALLFAPRLPRAPRPARMTEGEGVAATLNKQLLPVNAAEKKSQHDSVAAERHPRAEKQAPKLPLRPNRAAHAPQALETANAAAPRDDHDGKQSPPALAEPPTGALPTAELPGARAQLAYTYVKDEREMLKIDLRTGDPDVRIIWFSPQPGEQASPRKINDNR